MNVPSIRPGGCWRRSAPYLGLAEKLGNLLAQLDVGHDRAAGDLVQRRGRRASTPRPYARRRSRGCCSEASPEHVNLVNALLVARNRGLHVVERSSDEPTDNYSNLISSPRARRRRLRPHRRRHRHQRRAPHRAGQRLPGRRRAERRLHAVLPPHRPTRRDRRDRHAARQPRREHLVHAGRPARGARRGA